MTTTPKISQTTDALHPARLLLSAAISAEDFSRKFRPSMWEGSVFSAI